MFDEFLGLRYFVHSLAEYRPTRYGRSWYGSDSKRWPSSIPSHYLPEYPQYRDDVSRLEPEL